MKPSILLRTKFLVPHPNEGHFPRPHLSDWMEAQQDKRLVLISAPPGYGKTTLLADYLAVTSQAFAWYQLDANDSDPTVFLTYLIEALRRMTRAPKSVTQATGQTAQSLLETTEAAISHRRVLTVLINELAEELDETWLVVLEDYHYVTNPIVHQLVDFLLENAPPGLRLIISTRADPPLELARLRAHGQLAELRASDLRFRADEISHWMSDHVPGISNESLTLLSEKTEGWAAALQIVRSSLSGQDAASADRVIAGLSGSNRYVFEYLADEVFRRQPDQHQQFLLRTSVLEQMDAEVCNAIASFENSQAILEALERQNLFLTSLDTQRRWYRYHHLFRDFLLSKLRRERPDQVHQLQQTAGQYYERQGELEIAYRHYLEAREYAPAAAVISVFAADYVERGRVEVMHRYLSALPEEIKREHPELLLQHGNVHRRLGEAGLAITSYEDARAGFAAQNDQAGISRALTRLAEVNRAQGNYRQAEGLASEALQAAPPDDHVARADALMARAKSTGFLSGMDEGRTLAEQAVEEDRQAGDELSPLERASFLQSLGQICWWHGDPQATVRYCQEALQLAPDELSPIAAQAYISMVSPHLYWREFDVALHYAERGLEIAQTLHLKELLPSAYTALGNVLTRLGEPARAETALRKSMELAQSLGLASYEQLMATGYLAYNLYGQGRTDEAWQLAEGALWSYTGNPDTYEAYVCRSVLADVALENHQLEKAESLYSELVEVGERRQFRIPLAMVYFGLAYIHLETNRRDSGLEYARQALRAIEPSRAVQLFLDQGERTRLVCQVLEQAGVGSPFLERLRELMPAGAGRAAPEIANNSAITVNCLGTLRVFIGAEEISQDRWVSTKARDLLAYFVTFRSERIPGERAFEAIWGEKEGRSKTAFHTALSRLRNALRSNKSTARFVLVESGDYWLDAAYFKIDVDEFDAAIARARASTNAEGAAECFSQAVSHYQGEYMQNLYFDWVFPERRRLAQSYADALRWLIDYQLKRDKPREALDLAQKAIQLEPLSEGMYCQAMRAYAAIGDRTGLAQQYQDLKRVLASEMEIEPLPGTTDLYRELLENMNT